MRKLTEGYSSLVPHDVRSYFRDVDDHLVTVTERVAGFDELLTTLVDAALAKITMRQNNDMRKITAYAAMISVPTMIAGIYGMNFDFMPELHWRFGYPLVLLVIGSPVWGSSGCSAATNGCEPATRSPLDRAGRSTGGLGLPVLA